MPTLSSSLSFSLPIRNLLPSKVDNLNSESLSLKAANMQGCTLRKFPPEVRDMIYKLALPDEWSGKTPELLVALRQCSELYLEAIEAFREQKYIYTLHYKNDWSFQNMNPSTMASIKDVKIVITEDIVLHPQISWSEFVILPSTLSKPFTLIDLVRNCAPAKNTNSVTLDCRPRTENLFFWFQANFPLYVSGFRNLAKLILGYPLRPQPNLAYVRDEDRLISSDIVEDTMELFIKEADVMFGTTAKLDGVYSDSYEEDGTRVARRWTDMNKWIWVADQGKLLSEIQLPVMYGSL